MLHFSRWKTALVFGICLIGIALILPNFMNRETLDRMPGWFPANQIVLGLDLQGGSHLLLQVDTDAVVAERLESLRDDVRGILREGRIGFTGLRTSGEREVHVQIRESDRVSEAETRFRELSDLNATSLLTGGTVRDVSMEAADGGRFVFTLTEDGIDQRIVSAVEQSIEIVRRRIDELGTTEPTIQREGAERIIVQVPGLQDPQRLKDLIGQTAKLSFHMVDLSMPAQQAIETRPPQGARALFSIDDPPIPYLIERRALVSGENLTDAQPGFDPRTNEPVVTFRFDATGARRFGTATQQNVGRPFAIVLDDQIISAPVIREPILGGSGQISGNFTVEEANDLAILLRAGALPAPLTILEERTVGPSLGADSVSAGTQAGIIALVAVLIYMILSYGLFGVISALALGANIALLFGILSALQATLTLPGIAGIVLTVGMAVDANVLIFERIREEIRSGKSAIASLDAGFSRALSTILDANITTFIAAAILFFLGSGPIRGFAITLAIGIGTTIFTAFTLTRLIVAIWVRTRRPSTVPI